MKAQTVTPTVQSHYLKARRERERERAKETQNQDRRANRVNRQGREREWRGLASDPLTLIGELA